MEDIESYGIVSKEKKEIMLKDRIIAYIAILLTMLAFIFSCVGLNMSRQVCTLCSVLWSVQPGEDTVYLFVPLLQPSPEGRDGNGRLP